MSLSVEEKKDMKESLAVDMPSYPYGLKLHLDGESYEKLEMSKTPSVGDKFMMLCEVEVVSLEKANHRDDKEKYNMGLQITKMAINKEEKKKDAEEAIYGSEG